MSQPSAPHSAAEHGAEPPAPVRTAVKLMWAGAALTLVSLLLAPLQFDTIRDQIADQPPTPGIDTDTLVNFSIAIAVVVLLVAIGLWVLMAVMNRRGKAWARITATVLAGLNVLFTLLSVAGLTGPTPPAPTLVLSTVLLILAVVVVYLLWQRPATAWFDAMGSRSSAPA